MTDPDSTPPDPDAAPAPLVPHSPRGTLPAFNRIMEEDRAAGYDPWHDPEHPDYHGAAARAAAGETEAIRLPPPGWGDKEEEPAEEPSPRRHGLKDEGWG